MRELNEWIAKEFAELGKIEFVRGRGYFYFACEDYTLEPQSIGVCYLNHASLEMWKGWIRDSSEDAAKG